jgi:prepilin-type N-terminal cleavage/methylation domain-containing protein
VTRAGRPRPADPQSQRGFTLVELVAALAVGTLVIAGTATIIRLSAHVDRTVQANLESSTDGFRTSSLFADDVAATGPVPDTSESIGRSKIGCGGVPAALRLIGPGRAGGVVVRSYTQATASTVAVLERRQCSGPTLAAALAAPSTRETVAPDLAEGPEAVVVTCSHDGPSPPHDDDGCSAVTLTIATTSGFRFTVSGSSVSTRSPTATTAVLPARAPTTGTCTIEASATGWASSGGLVSGSGTANHLGDPTLYTYDTGGNRRVAYLQFDLTGPCVGPSDSWPTLPGGRLLTSVELWLTYLGKSSGSGVSLNGHRLGALDTASTWKEATLTGQTMPSGTRNSYAFDVANPGVPTRHVAAAITTAIEQWYAPGGWVNNGFRLSRSAAGDTLGKSNRFASRFNPNPQLRPRLVITWG